MSIAFDPTGSTLASGSQDGTVRLWDVVEGRQLGEPLAGHDGIVWSVAFSPTGETLASAGEDGTISSGTAFSGATTSPSGRSASAPSSRGTSPGANGTSFRLGAPYEATCPQWPIERG